MGRKFAVVSHLLPPSRYGQPRVLYRVLKDLPPQNYGLISSKLYDRLQLEIEFDGPWLGGRYYHLSEREKLKLLSRVPFVGRVWRFLSLPYRCFTRARRILAILKRENFEAVVACSGDLIDIPASYLAGKWASVPFHVWMFDDYVFQWTGFLERKFAETMERLFIGNAASVIVPNEFLRDEYRRRHGVEPIIVRNIPRAQTHVAPSPWPISSREISIAYTGSVYHAHFDAFRNLVDAIALADVNARLHIYSAQTQDELRANGIEGPVTHHGHLADDAVAEVQLKADILFLPLAFRSNIPEVIRTSAPGKLAEYLSSGRPILVHAPEDSFPSWYCRTHNCGAVVGAPDPVELAAMIKRLCTDAAFREALVRAAGKQVNSDFDEELMRTKFLDCLNA